ncbi:AfsR/SARP family transcriptional regulator [Nonomuraea sediminis]|uniref:AfsR/SARP family transcriptional regulator n=1 Tax=Nonomuraea sediminis TaxID=2835864 RepID=UPI001BDC1D64|nr:BTAD domain-containing putative transcriptional regulator [Nonomuraea sediminis]
MRFEVFGVVRGWRDGVELELGSPQQRLILAALLLARGRVLSLDQLVDVLWETDPPKTAVNAVRTYVSRLRGALGPEAIVTVGSGYQVSAELDLEEFEALAAKAEGAAPAEASDWLRRALALTAGEPLNGLPGHYAQAQRARLIEARLDVHVRAVEADLALDRASSLVGELTELCAAHPTWERPRALLMRALYRSGRQAEAIGAFHDTRRLLAQELGVEPSAELAAVYQEIITARPDTTPAPVRTVVVPRQLPLGVPDFTGRGNETAAMAEALTPGTALVVSAVAGQGGVGKTTLAVHVAHRLADRFPDGQLFADLLGSGPAPAEPEGVLGGFLRALGVPEPPDELRELSAMYRSMLSDRRLLVVLDNAASAAQVEPLLPGTPGCAVVVTSRARLTGLTGAQHLDLEVLEPGEALELLEKILGPARVAAERDAAVDLVAACGFLPLAIRIAAARLAARPGWTLAWLRDRLMDERRRLAELRVGDLAVESCFALGYDQLEPRLARAFRLLAVPDMPDVSLPAAAALLGLDSFEAEELCEELVDLSMLESRSPGRYRFHDLLRAFARSRVDSEADEALDRLLGYYAAAVANRFRSLFPGDQRAELVPTGECDDAFDPAETDALLSVVRQAAKRGHANRYRLTWTVDMLTDVAPESIALPHTLDLLVAHAAGDPRAEALARYVRSTVFAFDSQARRFDARTALDLAQDDLYVRAAASATLGGLAYDDGDYQASVEYLRQGVEVFAARGDRGAQALWLGLLARSLGAADDPGQAVQAAREAYRIHAELGGGTPRHPWAPYQFGLTLQATGLLEEASRMFEAAVVGFREIGELDWIGTSATRMAEIHLALDDPARALEHAEQGLAALQECGDEHWQGKALMILGQALTATGHQERGHACYVEALEIFDRLGLPEAEQARAEIDAQPSSAASARSFSPLA